MTDTATYIVMTLTADGIDWLAESPRLEAMMDARDSWLLDPARDADDRAWIQQTLQGMQMPVRLRSEIERSTPIPV